MDNELTDFEKTELGTNDSLKLAFVNFNLAVLTESEKNKLKKIHGKLNLISRLFRENGFTQRLGKSQNAKNKAICLTMLSEDEGNFHVLEDASSILNNQKTLLDKEADAKGYKIFERAYKKIKPFLIKNGWEVIENQSINSIHAIVSKRKPSEIFIHSHSKIVSEDSDGKADVTFLTDAMKGVFPSSFFANMPLSLKRIILYVCAGRSLVETYELNNKNYEVVFYEPASRYKDQLKDYLPNSSYKKVANTFKRSPNIKAHGERKDCSIDLNYETQIDGFAAYINDQMIGSLSSREQDTKIYFPCSFITKGENKITFFPTIGSNPDGVIINVNDVSLNSSSSVLFKFSGQEIMKKYKNEGEVKKYLSSFINFNNPGSL
ncbi:MAG: hypothetical protein QE271_07710 [Bacteriovoracaceae bacterium]|nr:hypothetical protein [Bacteriovoracaceae bacterium]